MNRRALVKAMLALSATSALGCKNQTEPNQYPPPRPEPSPDSSGTLKVLLHGAFAVVVQTRMQNRIKAFIPFDAQREHLFCFMSPNKVVSGRSSYEFVLDEPGLEVSRRPPYVDRTFDAFDFKLGPWAPNPKQYFVTIDLPAPDVISFIPPAESVVFGGRHVSMPVDHVLEYRVADPGKVNVRSQLGNQRPEPASALLADYQKHWTEKKEDMSKSSDTQRAYMEDEFRKWAAENTSIYLFGVGLPEERKFSDQYRKRHAIEFFNNELRGSFPNARELQAKRLESIDGYGPPCAPGKMAAAGQGEHCGNDEGPMQSGRLVTAALQDSMPSARLLSVAYTEDCRAGGLIGTTP